jgi:hypothetical protein
MIKFPVCHKFDELRGDNNIKRIGKLKRKIDILTINIELKVNDGFL